VWIGILILSGDCVNIVTERLCGIGIVIFSGDCVNLVTLGVVLKTDCNTEW
jgi:hypothetical protein